MLQTSTHSLSDGSAAVGESNSVQHRHITCGSEPMRGSNETPGSNEMCGEDATASNLLRPEARLLIACGRTENALSTQSSTQRTHSDAGTAYDIPLLLQQTLDWDYLLDNALRHGMEPLLYWHLKAVAPEARQAMPTDVWREIEQSFFYNIGKNLFLTRELLEIQAALAQQGIDAVPYKGPLVAAAFYSNPALRQYCDLDIFVSRGDILRARDVLRSLHFAPEFPWTAAQERAHLYYEDEYVFHRAADDITVELHWEFNARRSGLMLDTAHVWKQREAVVLNGMTVDTFAAQELLLVLCVHGYKHFWERLAWICDIAQMVKTRPDMAWDAVLLRAKAAGIQRILYLGLTLARDLLAAPLPPSIDELVRHDAATQKLADQVRANLFPVQYHRPTPGEMLRYHASMRERWVDKLSMGLRAATTPTLKDWAALPLPSSLFPLYYALRPLRLLSEASIGRLPSSKQRDRG
jgi:hypothetical protein